MSDDDTTPNENEFGDPTFGTTPPFGSPPDNPRDDIPAAGFPPANPNIEEPPPALTPEPPAPPAFGTPNFPSTPDPTLAQTPPQNPAFPPPGPVAAQPGAYPPPNPAFPPPGPVAAQPGAYPPPGPPNPNFPPQNPAFPPPGPVPAQPGAYPPPGPPNPNFPPQNPAFPPPGPVAAQPGAYPPPGPPNPNFPPQNPAFPPPGPVAAQPGAYPPPNFPPPGSYPPPGYGAPGYPSQPPAFIPPKPTNGLALAAFIVGIVSVCLFCVPFGGAIVALVAIGLGIAGIRRASKINVGKRQAITGLVSGVVVLIVNIVLTNLVIAAGPDLSAVECTLSREELKVAIEEYRSTTGDEPQTEQELVVTGYLESSVPYYHIEVINGRAEAVADPASDCF